MELSSFCNRKCNFCPNSFIDRTNECFMKHADFIKILTELRDIGYSNYISLSRYNEPTYHLEYLQECINTITEYLPDAKIVFNTNGDYDWQSITGADITVMDYDKPLPFSINNRAGSLNISGLGYRKVPCFEPNFFIGIDYTGDVVPCCNFRGDNPKHRYYILGNIKDNTLDEIYNSMKAQSFKKAVNLSKFPEPCWYCTKMAGRYTRDIPDKEGDMT